jgi:hypothetical protein
MHVLRSHEPRAIPSRQRPTLPAGPAPTDVLLSSADIRSLRGRTFANLAKLAGFIADRHSVAESRPDQGVVFIRDLATAAEQFGANHKTPVVMTLPHRATPAIGRFWTPSPSCGISVTVVAKTAPRTQWGQP